MAKKAEEPMDTVCNAVAAIDQDPTTSWLLHSLCENCDSRQCIEDEDYCRSCKEDLEEEEEEDSDEEGDGMMECLECKGRFPTTIISKWGSICAPCFQIHRKNEEDIKRLRDIADAKDIEVATLKRQLAEGKAMGAEDFDAPAPAPAPAPPPKPSAWDERVTGDFKNITFCEIFGDECTWRTLGNLSSDPDTDSQLDVRLHYYNEGKHFQVRVFVNGGSILDRHYSECGTLGEIFPHHMMEELEFYFPGYFEEDQSKENSLVSRINATL